MKRNTQFVFRTLLAVLGSLFLVLACESPVSGGSESAERSRTAGRDKYDQIKGGHTKADIDRIIGFSGVRSDPSAAAVLRNSLNNLGITNVITFYGWEDLRIRNKVRGIVVGFSSSGKTNYKGYTDQFTGSLISTTLDPGEIDNPAGPASKSAFEAKFDQINKNTSKAQVDRIIGFPGTRSITQNEGSDTYQWVEPSVPGGRKLMLVRFRKSNGSAAEKTYLDRTASPPVLTIERF